MSESTLAHWHGSPAEMREPDPCCVGAFRQALEKQAREHYRLRSDAVWEEARRIVTGMLARIDAYEAAILPMIGDKERRTLVSAVIAECRRTVLVAGCVCPRIDVTELGEVDPRYLPGRSPLCGVHGKGIQR